MSIKTILNQIGLKEKKAELYLACLKMGKATAYSLAEKSNVKRPTAYDIIAQLMKEGLLYKTIKNNVAYYSPADPEIFINKEKEREEKINILVPKLQEIFISKKIRPSIRYFEGEEGIKEMNEDSLRSLKKGDEILAYVGENILEHMPEHAKRYVKRRVERGIRLRGIYTDNELVQKYLKNNDSELRQVKIVDKKIFPITNETNIYKNKIAISSFNKELFGIIIESEEIYLSQKAIFELAWGGVNKFKNKN